MLEVHGLEKTFHPGTSAEVRALRGVSLVLGAGSFAVVIGTNGSGKSTLLNAVAGTFRLDSGRIVVAGRDVTGWPEHRRAGLLGRVFQNPLSGTAPGMTVEENLVLATRRGLGRGLGWARGRGLRDGMRDRVRALGMGLEDRLGNPMGALSGGQRQALTLLMATWRRPEVLLLDEHTAALDPRSADQVIRMTAEVVARERLTALMVTHSMQQAANLGDRVVMMHRGRVLHDLTGGARERLRAEDLLALFDGVRRREALDRAVASLLDRTYG